MSKRVSFALDFRPSVHRLRLLHFHGFSYKGYAGANRRHICRACQHQRFFAR